MSTFSDNLMSILPDRFYVSLKYFYRFHKFPNLKNPKTYNEKLQWMKLNDHNELYHTLADKYEVKKYVENLIGSEYVIKTLGVYDSFDEIDFTVVSGGISITDMIYGDVNNDGSVTVLDATMLQKHLAGLVSFSDEQLAVADTNGDGKITVLDATAIQKYLANLVTSLG